MQAFLSEPDQKIKVVFVGDDNGYATAKEVSASRKVRWQAGDQWPAATYPLTVDKCREMREVWADTLQVHKNLGAWYRQALPKARAQAAIGTQTDAELRVLPRLYPELNAYLFGDQRVTAAWMGNAYRGGGLLADEVGTGKTVGVVAGLIEAEVTGPTLIICPKISVKSVWGREFAQHAPDVPVYLARGARRRREAAIDGFMADRSPWKALVIVAEMLRVKALRSRGRMEEFLGYEYPELYDVEWSAVVVDESHKLLGSMDVVRGNLAAEGLRSLVYAPHRLKLAVSATPFGHGGRIDALFGTLHWLWPDEFPGKWAWLEKFFEVTSDKVFVKGGRGMTKQVRRVGGLKPGITEATFFAELGPRVLRRTMEEVSPQHRGLKNWITVACEMEYKQAKDYTTFADNAELVVDGGIISAVGPLDFMIRCRQLANGHLRKEGGRVVYTGESCKIDRLIAHLDQLDPDRKVVITSQYNEFLDAVEARLDKENRTYYRLDGKTSDTAREAMMGAFQGDPVFYGPDVTCRGCQTGRGKPHGGRCLAQRPRLFLLNSQAGGVSITLDAAEEMHQLDRMYPPEANTQLWGRIFRRGRAHEVLFYLYETMGTIDEHITENVEAGLAAQLKVLDGRRGLETVRDFALYRPEGTEPQVSFKGGPHGKIRKCRECGVVRHQWHIGDCTWEGE